MVAASDKKVTKSLKRSKSNNKKLSKSLIPNNSKRKDDNYLEESDGTWIKVISEKNNIKHLKINSPNQTQFDCWYFGESAEKYESELADKLNKLRTDAVVAHGMAVVGFDSESGDRLVQISSKHYAVLIHFTSGLIESECLKRFLAEQKVIFVGADVAVDALSINIHGLFDLSPIFSVLSPIFSHLQSEIKSDADVLDACDDYLHSASLKKMYEKTFKKTWVKGDTNKGLSWGCPHLTLSQLKYAALDAWVSCAVGANIVKRFATLGLFKRVFTTTILSESFRLKLKDLHIKADTIREEHSKKVMDVLSISRISNTQIKVKFATSTPHLCEGDIILFTVYRLQGSRTGVCIKGEVLDVIGQRAFITLTPISAEKRLVRSDSSLRRRLTREPASCLASAWQDGLVGGASSHTSDSPKERRGQSRQLLRVVVTRTGKDETIYPTVCRVITRFIRGLTVARDLFSSVTEPIPLPQDKPVTTREVAERRNAMTSLYMLSRDLSLTGAVKTLPIDAYSQALTRLAGKRILNPQQLLAVRQALGHSVSVISGPSSTGKASILYQYVCICHIVCIIT